MSESIERENALCSQYCEQVGIDLIGTSRASEPVGLYFAGYILVEYEGNWGSKIEVQEGPLGRIQDIIERNLEMNNTVWRLQAIKNDETSTKETNRVIVYRNNDLQRTIPSFEKENYTLQSLKDGDIDKFFPLVIAGYDKNNKKLDLDMYRDTSEQSNYDVLVCNHAERDVCCGKFGYPIYKHLQSMKHNQVKLWRTSHIGGHRTAPTMVEFIGNQARFWGYLTAEVAEKIVLNQLNQDYILNRDELNKHYRGLVGLSPKLQLVERNGWVKHLDKWDQNNLRVKILSLEGRDEITIISGGYKIVNSLQSEPEIIEIGETKCAYVKPAKQFVILDSN